MRAAGFLFILVFSFATRSAQSACARFDWSCFDASVAIVARDAEGRELAFCSGVAVSVRRVLTAGHCAVRFSALDVDHLDVYLDALVDKTGPEAARGFLGGLHVNGLYNRPKSFYFHDRGVLELDRDLPRDLNFPIIASLPDAANGSAVLQNIVAKNLIGGVKLERIGFGARQAMKSSATASAMEHRRTPAIFASFILGTP